MRHNNKNVILGREKAPREALMRNLAESLILYGAIKTTKAKARALRSFVEPLVTKAKKGDLAARRFLIQSLYTDQAVNKLLKELGPTYKERKGGYTRIIKIGSRTTDAAEMVRIEFV